MNLVRKYNLFFFVVVFFLVYLVSYLAGVMNNTIHEGLKVKAQKTNISQGKQRTSTKVSAKGATTQFSKSAGNLFKW